MLTCQFHEIDRQQSGGANDPLLPDVDDLRERTSGRESAAILAYRRVFLGSPGFVMHLARAPSIAAP